MVKLIKFDKHRTEFLNELSGLKLVCIKKEEVQAFTPVASRMSDTENQLLDKTFE